MSDSTSIKTALLAQIQQLDPQDALLPSGHPEIDEAIAQLEPLTPIAQPLDSEHWSQLLGTWTLIYASRGTVVTRRINQPSSFELPKVQIQQVWQTLSSEAGQLLTENGAKLILPVLGSLKLLAHGVWTPTDDQTATVTFHKFVFQLTVSTLGWQLPQLTLPIPSFWQREATWITSYLDHNLRFGRGATGNLFVFVKDAPTQTLPSDGL
ncbi:MAG: PAP fibrillin [Spirulina sp. SIO3F2]|nr:PAP fibrillin [Spirulina sp. SIO3F2]